MASGYGVPVRFTKEKNVWDLFGIFNIGSGGAINVATVATGSGPQFITKGIANVWQNTPTFTGSVASGSSTITSVSSFNGIYTGMSVTGAGVPAGLTLGTISQATGSVVLSGQAGATGTFVASGGQYVFQFGVNTSVGSLSQMSRLDTYNRLLQYQVAWDSSMSSVSAGVATSVGTHFVDTNNITQKTIPSTLTSNSTDATLVIQFGVGNGTGFVAAVPNPGFVMRASFTMGNTTSI